MSMIDDWRQMRDAYRMNPVGFAIIMLGLLTYIGVFAWLMVITDHPQAAGSTCRRKCMIEAYWFSPHLLGGGVTDWLLFIWLWSLPATVVGAIVIHRLRRRRDPLATRIHPQD